MSALHPQQAELPRGVILGGDATLRLRELPDETVDCVVTSPPYFRLRDYGHQEQLGLEAHVDQWVGQLRAVTQEIARVLVPTGTLWLNLGDAYSTHHREGAPRKGLLLAPERLVMALVDDGWIIRNKIVWAKTNTVPSSVRDRLSTGHEFIYVLARQPGYFFDLDAIRVPHTSRPPRRGPETASPPRRRARTRPSWLGPNSDGDGGLVAMHAAGVVGHPLGKNPGDVWSMSVSRYRGAHFATYPEHLVERMLRAACPEARCSRCHAPWRRPVRRRGTTAVRQALQASCRCQAPREPGLVLDPFLGSGTTAVVAERLGRDWLGIELNGDYIRLAQDRLSRARDPTPRRQAPTAETTNRKEVI